MTKATNVKRPAPAKPIKPSTKHSKAPAVAQRGPEPETLDQPRGKLGILVTMLRRPDGARIAEMQAATGWQAHSIRGAMSGTIKKKLGLDITSSAGEGGRTYRIAARI